MVTRQIIPTEHASPCPQKVLAHLLLIMAAAALFLLCTKSQAQAEIVQDTVATLGSWSFDQADCGCPPCIENCSLEHNDYFDLTIVFIFSPPLGDAAYVPHGGLALGDVPIDSVLQAPESGYSYRIDAGVSEEFQINRTYIVRSKGGGHAVIRPLEVNVFGGRLVFAYKFQSDGTGIFNTNTAKSSPTEASTWGRVKSLYLRYDK